MRFSGIRARNLSAMVFNVTILVALPCHAVETTWFWGIMAVFFWTSFLVIIGLEAVRLFAPGFTDSWWEDG